MSLSREQTFDFKDFPVLQSSRLLFRSLSVDNAEDIYELRLNEDVIKYIDRKPPKDIEAAKTFIDYVNTGFIKQKFIFWGIRLSSNDRLIGTASLWHFTDDKTEAEVGYELHPSHWGKGYAHEALKEITNFSREVLKLKKMEAFTHHENVASRHVLVKNKFVLNQNRVDEGNQNNVIYELKM